MKHLYKYKNKESGFVKIIIIIIILIIILSYFGFNIRTIIENPTTQNNLSYVWGLTVSLWQNYLREPFVYVRDVIFKDLILGTLLSSIKG